MKSHVHYIFDGKENITFIRPTARDPRTKMYVAGGMYGADCLNLEFTKAQALLVRNELLRLHPLERHPVVKAPAVRKARPKLSEEQRIANAIASRPVMKVWGKLKEVDDWIGVRPLAQWLNWPEVNVRSALHWLKRAGLAAQRDSPKSMGKPQFKQWKVL
jgi:hypothetical protein